ncbi:lytic murein transglycosylase [Candidatus Tokpelaia sp.]|uniref:lytic murein transglycosylase n=1 Tax=Candidatus Tokpelaia sp. TaxID=2233777 RepID=UPI001FED63B0|nr:lytic murein transglycosylase [Candidatus Tokpelaia sp.]
MLAGTVFSLDFVTFQAWGQTGTLPCGTKAAGFPAFVQAFKQQAAGAGIGRAGLEALEHVRYAYGTIAADRNQRSFKLSFEQFLHKRGAAAIIRRGRVLKRQNAALFARIEKQYGMPAGPLLAIWGMESAFGSQMGKQNILSAAATLAYDCRRSQFFTGQLYAALQLIDKGSLRAQATGAMHGEIGQTQFLPLNVLHYGVDEDGDGVIDLIHSPADALASTARFLQAHGWQRGQDYQPGEPNFTAIEGWNKAKIYQRAIAYIGQQIDAP